MSRSIKGGKSPSTEYWTPRPFNRCGGQPGADTKRRTHRAERQDGKNDVQRQHRDSGRENF